jgi:hypothetical protein
LIYVLLINFDALVSKFVPSNHPAFLNHSKGLVPLVDVIHKLRKVAKELSVTPVVVEILLCVQSKLTSFVECRLSLSVVHLHHKVNLVKLSNKEIILN